MDLDIQQLAKQKMEQEAFVNKIIVQTAGQIYAQLIAKQAHVTPDILRTCAINAKIAAPYLAEAYGLCKVTETTNENVGGDS